MGRLATSFRLLVRSAGLESFFASKAIAKLAATLGARLVHRTARRTACR